MIHRWTLWETEDGEPLQMSLALLDDGWEPLHERTLPCGPFHTAEDRRLELIDDLRRYVSLYGIALRIFAD